jgi:putative membrane protein
MTEFNREYPGIVTTILTVVGYALVIGTLYGDWLNGIYPEIGLETVNLLSHAIALNNLAAVLALGLGWWFIRDGRPRRHRLAMIVGFSLIMVFLVLYLIKTGGGGRKEFVIQEGHFLSSLATTVTVSYYMMLAIHVLLSIISVPLVLYAMVLGLSRPLEDVSDSPHASIGPWAAGSWIVSLALGLLCYILLNHVYAYEFVPA